MRQSLKFTAFRALNSSSVLSKTAFASTMAVALMAGNNAYALPSDPNVEAGTVTFNQPDSKNLIVNQGSDRAIINWSSFDILHGESTRFIQPGANSIALNRITNGNPTQILGNLSANGKLVLVNPNGVFFGAGSRVDVAGLIASTADISSNNFMAGNLKFDHAGRADASIINKGTISATDGGLVALVAPGVRNDGVIQANLGTVVLASGTTATVDMYGDNLYSFAVTGKTTSAAKDENGNSMADAVANTGTITSNGGKVLLTANAAKDVVTNVVNNTGVIEASAARIVGGEVILDGGDEGNVHVAGSINVAGKNAGQKGGKVTVTGETIKLAAASIDSSGKAGGGAVRVGGDYQGGGTIKHAKTVAVDSASVINVSATDGGNAGSAVVWSDTSTSFAGTMLGTGGANGGDGAQLEISSKGDLAYSGFANAAAVLGKAGQLLLDPTNVIVDSVMAASTVATLNTGTDVTISTPAAGPQAGSITVNSGISWFGLGSLTLDAINGIIINADIKSTTTAGTGSNGAIKLTAGGNVAVNNATLEAARGNITVTGNKVSLMNSFIHALRGNIDIQNKSSFTSNTANALYNDAGQAGYVHVNQSQSGSIQNAIDAIGTTGTGGGKVTLTSGNWYEQVLIDQANLTLTGQGTSSVIHGPTSTPLTTYNLIYKTTTPIVFVNNAKNVTVSNLKVDGTGSLANSGIAFNHSPNAVISGTTVSNIAGDGILLFNTRDGLIQNNTVSNTLANRPRDEGSGIRLISATGATVNNNTINHAGWDGIKITGGLYYTVTNNKIDTADRVGIMADGMSFSTISNNLVNHTMNNAVGFAGININGASNDNLIADNRVYNVANGDGIRLNTNSGTNTISGNKVDQVAEDGINLVHATNANILNNTISHTGRDGIHLDDVTNINIAGNIIRDGSGSGIWGIDVGVNEAGFFQDGYDYSQNLITGNSIYRMTKDGIHLNGVANTYVATNTIHDIGGDGIFATGLYIDGEVTPAPLFTLALPTSFATASGVPETYISGNTIYKTGHDGIHLEEVANANVTYNDVSRTGNDGIFAFDLYRDSGTPTFTLSAIDTSTATGVSDISHNQVYLNDHDGIHLETVQNANVTYNHIFRVAHDGIFATDLYVAGTKGSISDTFTEKGFALDAVDSLAYDSLFDNNRLLMIGHDGIHLEGIQNLVVSNSDIHDVTGDGIFATQGFDDGGDDTFAAKTLALIGDGSGAYDNAVFVDNVVYFANNGIHLVNMPGASVDSNGLLDFENAGLFAEFSDDLSVINNYAWGSPFGMKFEGSFDPTISGNDIRNNGIGVDLHISDGAVLNGNIFTNNTIGLNLHDNFFTRVEGNTFNIPVAGVGLRIAEGSIGTVVQDSVFNGGNIGIEITDPGSFMAFEGNNSRFTGQNFYFVLQNGAMAGLVLDASQQLFEGIRASDFTQAQLDAAEGLLAFGQRTVDVADDSGVGDVFYKAFGPIVPPTIITPAFDTSVLDDFQNSKRNAYRRGNFSYAGRVFTVTPDPVEPNVFDLGSINLSLLNRASPAAAADVANLFATLAPAAGGNKPKNPTNPQDLANLAPAAGGSSQAQSFTALAPSAGGAAAGGSNSCGNSFLGDGYAPGFSCGANQ